MDDTFYMQSCMLAHRAVAAVARGAVRWLPRSDPVPRARAVLLCPAARLRTPYHDLRRYRSIDASHRILMFPRHYYT
jgi:hypothetical protein